MSKLQFRARALDASKPMPIYMSEELPDLTDYTAINRAVPQMPSGMEKEEECEHHLQRAICTGLIIPTPEVSSMADAELYERMYPANYKQPRQLIHMQPLAMEQDIPDYDMDSDDEVWVTEQAQRLEVSPLKFESMMDRLEKSSGQTVITLHEAKGLLNDDDDLIIAVYDYWLNKRLKTQHPLILAVKTEHRLGSAANNPYIAFRRRTEKMQTRKNRKNDETSYEKMLKLRRDLSRALTLLELVKRREKAKREHLHLTIEIAEKRYQAQDFSGALVAEMSALKTNRPAFTPLYPNQFSNHNWVNKSIMKDEIVPRKEKRQYKKRKHKASHSNRNLLLGSGLEPLVSSDEEDAASAGTMLASPAEPESQDDEAPYVFRRNKNCSYHMPLKNGMGGWPWSPPREDNGIADIRYRYTLTSISRPVPRCIGFARRRVGRGGRVILDRASTAYDDIWRNLDFTIVERPSIQERIVCENAFQIKSEEQKEMSRCNETASSELNNLFSEHNYNLTCRIRQECTNEPIVKSEWTSGSNVVSNGINELVGKTEGVSDCSVINKSGVDTNSDAILTTFKQDDFDDNRFITDFLKEVKTEWPHFRPKTPPEGEEVPCHLLPYTEESFQFNPSDLTPITVEIDNVLGSPPSMLLDTSTFTSEFTLNDLYLDLNLDNVQTCEDDLGLILNDTRQDLKNTSFRDSGGDSTNSIGKKYLSDQFGCSRVTVTEHGRTNNSECGGGGDVGGTRGAHGGRAPDGGASKFSGKQTGCGTQMVLEHVGATRHTTSTAVRVFELVNHISRPTDTHLTNGPLAAVSLSESSLNRRGNNKQLLHNSTEDETPDGAMVGITLPAWSSSSSVYRLTNSSPQVRRISPAQTTHTLNSNSANNVDSMSPPLADSIDTTLVRSKSHHGHNNIDGNTANTQSKQAQGPGKQIVRKNNATTLAPMEVT